MAKPVKKTTVRKKRKERKNIERGQALYPGYLQQYNRNADRHERKRFSMVQRWIPRF